MYRRTLKKKVLEMLGIAICDALLLFSGVVNAEPVIYSQPIYHRHSGGENGGGCYTVAHTDTKEIDIPCGGTMVYWPELNTSSCSVCGASYFGDQSGRKCWHSEKKSITETYYTPGCGMDETTVLGTLYLEKSTEEWVHSLTLKASYECGPFLSLQEAPFLWNGGEATEEKELQVTENGTYHLQLNVNGRDNLTNPSLTLEIKNIDYTAPVIEGPIVTERGFVKEGVLVSLANAEDLQPDGSLGSGLHEFPFSYDGGASFTDKNQMLLKENGSYCIVLRDRLENAVQIPLSITQIDQKGPLIKNCDITKEEESGSYRVSIEAVDVQEDGSPGSGLPLEAYSFDGGENWGKESFQVFSQDTEVAVWVRDQLGNITKQMLHTPIENRVEDEEKREEVKPDTVAVEPPKELPKQQTAETELELQEEIKEIPNKKKEKEKQDCGTEENTEEIVKLTERPVVTIYGEQPERKVPAIKETVVEEEKKTESRIGVKILSFVIGTFFFLLLIFLFLNHLVFVYAKKDRKYQFRGILVLHKKEKTMVVRMRKSLWENCVTTNFLFRMPIFYYLRHQKENINFIFPNNRTIIQEIGKKNYVNLV